MSEEVKAIGAAANAKTGREVSGRFDVVGVDVDEDAGLGTNGTVAADATGGPLGLGMATISSSSIESTTMGVGGDTGNRVVSAFDVVGVLGGGTFEVLPEAFFGEATLATLGVAFGTLILG